MKTGRPGTSFKPGKYVCVKCRGEQCQLCVDLTRAKANLGRICECPRH